MTIEEIVNGLRTNSIRAPNVGGDESLGVAPMIFASSFAHSGATADECDAAARGHCPADLKEFWQLARLAKLFQDMTYGQWGLEILSPEEAVDETKEFQRDRAEDTADGDLIVGRFIGDSDLLLVRTDPEATDFGSVIIAEPIDGRADWDAVADSFGEFLNRYVEARGGKYWTPVRVNIEEVIAKLKHTVCDCEFCDKGVSEVELMSTLGFGLPPGLSQFWTTARWARLWGLQFLTPTDAARETHRQSQERRNELNRGDLVAGRFLGAPDLLVIPCDQAASDFGNVLVARPLVPRQEWYAVGDSFEDFLTRYVEARGDKYWVLPVQIRAD